MSHQRVSSGVSGRVSTQNPWKHCCPVAVAAVRSARTVSSLGIRLKIRNRVRSTTSRQTPTVRFLLRADSNMMLMPSLPVTRVYMHVDSLSNTDIADSCFSSARFTLRVALRLG